MTKNDKMIMVCAAFIVLAVYEALINRHMLVSISLLAVPVACCLVFWSGTGEEDWPHIGEKIIRNFEIDGIIDDAREIAVKGNAEFGELAGSVRTQASVIKRLMDSLDRQSIRDSKSCPLDVVERTCAKTIRTYCNHTKRILNCLDNCLCKGSISYGERKDILREIEFCQGQVEALRKYLYELGLVNIGERDYSPEYITAVFRAERRGGRYE